MFIMSIAKARNTPILGDEKLRTATVLYQFDGLYKIGFIRWLVLEVSRRSGFWLSQTSARLDSVL